MTHGETQSRSIRALRILEQVAGADGPVRVADLAAACALPKASVHRICALLLDRHFLDHDLERKGFVPGRALAELAKAAFANRARSAGRHALLEWVARQVGETCNLAVPDGTAMLYWDRVEALWPLQVQLPVGTRVPLHCTASGKLYLGSLRPAQRRRLVDSLELKTLTPNTISDPGALDAALAEIARTGIGTDDEETIAGMIAVAVPVNDRHGRLFATLSINAPVVRMSLEQALGHVDVLREAARKLGAEGDASDPRDAMAARAPEAAPGA